MLPSSLPSLLNNPFNPWCCQHLGSWHVISIKHVSEGLVWRLLIFCLDFQTVFHSIHTLCILSSIPFLTQFADFIQYLFLMRDFWFSLHPKSCLYPTIVQCVAYTYVFSSICFDHSVSWPHLNSVITLLFLLWKSPFQTFTDITDQLW
jgi:hypothetical protein